MAKSLFLAAMVLSLAGAVAAQGTLPEGTKVPVLLGQSVSSKDATLGQVISGTVAEDIVRNGKVVIPRGTKANLKVVSVNSAGRLTGQPKLWLRLTSVEMKGKTYAVTSLANGQTGASRGKRTAVGAGGGAVAGAVIGAIAGGGKGAAIGAAAGAGAGTAGAAATGKTEVEFSAEQTMNFSLKTALTVR
jgi:hypothetical protein